MYQVDELAFNKMELDRSTISRSGSRPITRWRREQESSEKSQGFSERPGSGISRPYSKMERPTSRRGIKADITEYGISRPPTSNRSALSRPPSPNILSNRVSTAASRMNALSSASLTRINSGLPRNFAQLNSLIFDRPITQQGLAGIRPGSSRGIPKLARQIQDKQYYKQLLQQKIHELNQEIATISQQVERQTNEKVFPVNNDQKTKNIDSELTELQNQIDDYNITLNRMTFNTDKEEIKREAKQLKELSDQKDVEIQNVTKRREFIENKLLNLSREIESKEKNDLLKEIDSLEKEYDQLTSERTKLEEKIAFSPIKQEAYKLYFKIFEAEQKREKLLEDENNSSTSEEDKVKLSRNRREDNLDASMAERQIIEIQKKIADAEQELEQLETDTDENYLDKQIKYNKQKRREENFMSMHERGKVELLEQLNHLEEQIVYRLERISNSINDNVNSSMLAPDEVDMLKMLMNQNFENHNEKSSEELKQENIRLRQILNKLQGLESKLKIETNAFEEYGESSNDKQKDLFLQREDIIEQERKTSGKLQIIKKDYTQLKEKIEQNEIYRVISILEDKLRNIKQENEPSEESILESPEQEDQSILKEKLFSLTAQYNTLLINEMKLVY